MIEIMEVNEEGKKNKEIIEGRLDSFQKKCVRKTYSGANYICRNEYIFSFYTN